MVTFLLKLKEKGKERKREREREREMDGERVLERDRPSHQYEM